VSRRRAALLAMLAAAALLPAVQATGAPTAAPALTVLVVHPHDGVDPFGIAMNGTDPFAERYGPLVADKGRFDFPFFVTDGVEPIESLPDPGKPYVATHDAYAAAIAQRTHEEPPATLTLASHAAGDQALVDVAVAPRQPLPGEHLHLWLALAEDHVRYQPPPGLTNGVTDHRFTLRAVADLGALDLAAPANATHTFQLDPSWARDRLSVAAWLQQAAPTPRFDAREVAQATHADLGATVVQQAKGVLVEEYSATWCDPCLYGDKALEDLAVSYGVADAAAAPSSRYLHWTAADAVPVLVAALLGAGVVALAWRRP